MRRINDVMNDEILNQRQNFKSTIKFKTKILLLITVFLVVFVGTQEHNPSKPFELKGLEGMPSRGPFLLKKNI